MAQLKTTFAGLTLENAAIIPPNAPIANQMLTS